MPHHVRQLQPRRTSIQRRNASARPGAHHTSLHQSLRRPSEASAAAGLLHLHQQRRSINRRHVYTYYASAAAGRRTSIRRSPDLQQREAITQRQLCVRKPRPVTAIRKDLSIAGMYIQSRLHLTHVRMLHNFTRRNIPLCDHREGQCLSIIPQRRRGIARHAVIEHVNQGQHVSTTVLILVLRSSSYTSCAEGASRHRARACGQVPQKPEQSAVFQY